MRKRGLNTNFGGLIAAGPSGGPELLNVAVSAIVPNPHQPRIAFDENALEELAGSIKEHGLLQPLVVTRLPDGDYQLIAGERRWRAAKRADLETVPVVIKEATPQQQLELALIENIQRADLDPIEEARAYAVLEDQFGLNHKDIGERVSKSRSTVSETLGLLRLPHEVQKLVSAGQLKVGHASLLHSLRDDQSTITAAQHIAERGLSVRRAEEYIRQLNDTRDASGKELAPSKQHQDATPEDIAIVQSLEEQLSGLQVKLQRTGRGGRLVIYFDNEEMLSSLYDRLMAL